MVAPNADISGLKQRIDKLRETNTYSQIRDFIRHQQTEEQEGKKKININQQKWQQFTLHSKKNMFFLNSYDLFDVHPI